MTVSNTVRKRRRSHEIHKAARKELYKISQICYWCGRYQTESEITLDHLVPLSKNGSDSIENLVLSCSSCNSFRGSSSIYDGTIRHVKHIRHAFAVLKRTGEIVTEESLLDKVREIKKRFSWTVGIGWIREFLRREKLNGR